MIIPQGYFNALPIAYGEQFVGRPEIGPNEVATLGGDALTTAWRLAAVGLAQIHDQRVGQALEWLQAASELGIQDLLLEAEISTGFGWEGIRIGEPHVALGHLHAADAAWERLAQAAYDKRWPQVMALLEKQMRALNLGQKLPGDGSPGQLIQIWRSTRAAAARTQVWISLADVYHRMGHTDEAVELVNRGITWLTERFPINVPTQAHDLVWQLRMTLGSLRQNDDEGLKSFRAAKALYEEADWAQHAEHRVAVAGLGEANTLVKLGRPAEAIPVYENSAEILERWQQPGPALQSRMGALLARADLGRVPDPEAELRAFIQDVESTLGKAGSATGFAVKADFVVAYTRLLRTLAELPPSPIRVEAFTDIVEALRRPEILSEVGRIHPTGWLAQIRSRARLVAARLATRPDWCLLMVQTGGERLTFLTIRGGPGSFEERVALSTASPELMDALEPFMRQVTATLEIAIESPVLATGLSEPDLEREAETIWAALPPVVRQTLTGASTILYSPDPFGTVDELPLEAVRAPDGWLGETRVIARQRSVDDAIAALAPTAPGADRQATVVRAAEPPGFAVLTHADDECRITELAGSALKLPTDVIATESDEELIAALARPAALIHVIGHGVGGEFYEGIPVSGSGSLGVHDIPPLSGRPVCFLNACELGRSRYLAGGGGRGLVPALRDAGASAVLAWTQAAPDRLAPLAAREFYRAVRDGQPVGEALVATRTRLHERGVSPAITACLVLFGDPRAHIGPVVPAQNNDWPDTLIRYVATRDDADGEKLLAQIAATPGSEDVATWLRDGADDTLLERLADEDLLGTAALALLKIRAVVDGTRLRDDASWPDLMIGIDIAVRAHATLAHASFCLDLGTLGLGRFDRATCVAQLRTAVHELEPWRTASPALAVLHRQALRHLRTLSG